MGKRKEGKLCDWDGKGREGGLGWEGNGKERGIQLGKGTLSKKTRKLGKEEKVNYARNGNLGREGKGVLMELGKGEEWD